MQMQVSSPLTFARLLFSFCSHGVFGYHVSPDHLGADLCFDTAPCARFCSSVTFFGVSFIVFLFSFVNRLFAD